jgi:hypothetical protein
LTVKPTVGQSRCLHELGDADTARSFLTEQLARTDKYFVPMFGGFLL